MTRPLAPTANAAWRRSALLLLIAVGLCNFVDRLCMSVLSVPIRQELSLTDAQIGILTGLAFSLVYTFGAVPIAALADRGSRKRVLVWCLAVWSLVTAACGLATGFAILAVLRMLVALGEAGCVPATQAILSEYFPREQRARALTAWQLVFPVGAMLGFWLSGYLNDAVGWRATFVILGAGGLVLVPVVLCCLREPPRHVSASDSLPRGFAALSSAVRSLCSEPALRMLLVAGGLMAYPLNAALYWSGQFYARVFQLELADLAWRLAVLTGVAGVLGLLLGGWCADRLGQGNARRMLWVPGIAGIVAAPSMLLQYFAESATVSLLGGFLTLLMLNAFMPPQAAAVQALASPAHRALAAALIVLVSGTVGTAAGPFLTGLTSDWLARRYGMGSESLRWAIGGASALALLGGIGFLAAARHYAIALRR
ncbi:MAG: MFS transporter [Steroidobacteraceae bacterium]|nr:MFS transporter [Steroidobacteraceae bacterium]MDW8260669.1 MFS transporter [Gammaproteobacteria bacterium]